jgi:hypothetical protein
MDRVEPVPVTKAGVEINLGDITVVLASESGVSNKRFLKPGTKLGRSGGLVAARSIEMSVSNEDRPSDPRLEPPGNPPVEALRPVKLTRRPDALSEATPGRQLWLPFVALGLPFSVSTGLEVGAEAGMLVSVTSSKSISESKVSRTSSPSRLVGGSTASPSSGTCKPLEAVVPDRDDLTDVSMVGVDDRGTNKRAKRLGVFLRVIRLFLADSPVSVADDSSLVGISLVWLPR